jgi:predicted phosphodiesterase
VDVLRRPERRARMLEAVADADRLVLLGDVVELRHGPLRQAFHAAEPVLREIGGARRPGSEVVLVPGNHDHRLARGWLERRAARGETRPLGLEGEVDWRDGEPLAALAGWLGAESVGATYPGVWLDEDVYATHGHYGDRHNTVPIMERAGAGLMARVVNEPDGGPRRAEDYEATLAPMYAWIDAVAENGGVRGRGGGGLQVRAWRALAQPGGRMVRSVGLTAAFSGVVAVLNRTGFGPLTADVSGAELRRGGLRGFEEVLTRLGVNARHVIFGHTHRAGPLPGDDGEEWRTSGGTSLLNTGSWVHDRGWVGETPSGPYRPGFCAVLGDGAAPQLLNLLDRG